VVRGSWFVVLGSWRAGVVHEDLERLAEGVRTSYEMQLGEGMTPLPDVPGALAKKYCGGGWGGYAVYLFQAQEARDQFVDQPGGVRIEPYLRNCCEDCS